GYDGLSRMTALTHMAAPTTLIDNQYSYNDANNITSWTNASGNHTYGYDLVDRLASATNSAQPNENYAYDGVGNRTASHLSASYSYQPFNKLASTAAATYTYDNNGNVISRTDGSGTTTFGYNEENRLTQVTLPTDLTVNYKYDAFGRRIQRTATTGANERYVYDSADVLLDLNADGSVATTYLSGSGIDNHLRQSSATTGVSYYLSDHLGSTAGMTDASGNLVETDSYDSFGNSAGSGLTRYGYTGRERDPDTGMMYYRARWYDPQVGRFLSEDPIGFDGGMNWYSYVENDPIDYSDPSGLQKVHGNLSRFCNDCNTIESDMARVAASIATRSAELSNRKRIGLPINSGHTGRLAAERRKLEQCKKKHEECKKKDCPNTPVPVPVPNPSKARRPNGPTLEELRLQEESALQMESFWTKVLIGDAAAGAVVLAPEGAAVWVLRWVGGSLRWVPATAP
ncbi:MAG TPA: RHS repeat-associated core domain-containing protein, partial [Pyrinomonadaceae bacterium]